MDDIVLDYFRDVFGAPLTRIQDSSSFSYMGSPASVPCECSIDEAIRVIEGPAHEVMVGDPAKVNVSLGEELTTPWIDLRDRERTQGAAH
ncbi:MAG: hypothetical protein R2704_14125 [Microthrixaceae bacterium]